VHPTDKRSKKQSSTIISIESDEDKTLPEDTWPKAFHLRPGALMQQSDLICAVCRDAIQIVENTLVMQDAWPKLHQNVLYKRQVLLEAVKSLQEKNTGDDEGKQEELYRAFQTQISRDKQFVRYIGKWVRDLLHFSIKNFNDTFNYIGHRSSIPSPWTDAKCSLRSHCYFPAWCRQCVCSMCPGVDWEWRVCLSWAMGHW